MHGEAHIACTGVYSQGLEEPHEVGIVLPVVDDEARVHIHLIGPSTHLDRVGVPPDADILLQHMDLVSGTGQDPGTAQARNPRTHHCQFHPDTLPPTWLY